MTDYNIIISGAPVDVTVSDEKGATSVVVSHVQSSAGNLYGLGDVDVTGLQDGHLLVYNSTTSKWQATSTLRESLVDGGNF